MLLLFFSGSNTSIWAQTNEFTYQGNLNESGARANGNYDLEFRLYTASSGGFTLGTRSRLNVPISNGVFSVTLDFPAANFSGGDRWLEIGVKPAGSANPFTVLSPRQKITSSPYSVRSANAANAETATNSTQLGGVAANQFVQTNDSRLTDARNPLPGSNNYIQNNPSLAGQNATIHITNSAIIGNDALIGNNLTVNGNASASVFDGTTFNGTVFNGTFFNATSNFRINGQRVLGVAGTNNTFAGLQTGSANTGADNSFFGFNAGNANGAGSDNSFFGSDAGGANTGGSENSFFGSDTGDNNTSGSRNSFFGRSAGGTNTTASDNSFFGYLAGGSVTANGSNAFFGSYAGENSTGHTNSFFGAFAGRANTSGNGNSFFGWNSGLRNSTGSGNTFIGEEAGENNTSGNLNTFIGQNAGENNTSGTNNTAIGNGANFTAGNFTFATAVGAGATADGSNRVVLGRSTDTVKVPGDLEVAKYLVVRDGITIFNGTLNREVLDVRGYIRAIFTAADGPSELCRNFDEQIAFCSSSLRYKTDVETFSRGLDVVRRLRPITFTWRKSGIADLGFGAEEVEQIEPLLVIRNKEGEIESVKYKQITTVLVNAVNEQQTEIEAQQKQIQTQQSQFKEQQQVFEQQQKRIEELQAQIEALKATVCAANPQTTVCREKQK